MVKRLENTSTVYGCCKAEGVRVPGAAGPGGREQSKGGQTARQAENALTKQVALGLLIPQMGDYLPSSI